MSLVRAAIFAALFIFQSLSMSWAQDVTLTSRDGAVEINGTLLGYDGEFYRVDTVYGELTVDGSGVLCDGPACPDLQAFVAELRISGAATMGDVLLPALIESFGVKAGYSWKRDAEDDAHIEYILTDKSSGAVSGRFYLRITNTDEGFADLLANEADIVMSLREIRQDEAKRAFEAGMGNMKGKGRSRVLALDALVAITAPDNPVKAITTPQLAGVFAGQITNWATLGGPDAPISLHLTNANTGIGQAVEDRLLLPVGLSLAANVMRHPTTRKLARAIETDPFGIGISSLSETGNAEKLTLSGGCGFALTATRRTVKTEDYPLTAPMFLYLPARRLPKLAREFLAYTRTPSAQLVIRRAGFVDQAPEEIAVADQGDRLANAVTLAGPEISLSEIQRMVGAMRRTARLSTTFRFEAGSARLDAQSRSNVQQLARALEAGLYDTRRLIFVGFSDGNGSAQANREIALRRAKAVKNAVSTAAETANLERITLETDAFGEAMPMACDDSEWGRQVNRRVEIWVE